MECKFSQSTDEHGIESAYYAGGDGSPYYQPVMTCICGYSTGRCGELWQECGELLDEHLKQATTESTY